MRIRSTVRWATPSSPPIRCCRPTTWPPRAASTNWCCASIAASPIACWIVPADTRCKWPTLPATCRSTRRKSWPYAKGVKEPKSKLAEAAEKAHTLTEALRLKGYEAYEFHDRYQSIVTVGSFNSAGTPRADGKIEINPAIHRIMQQFGATAALPGQPPGAMKVTSLLGISFDIQPIPVEVPKRSISRELARRLDPGDDTQ